jgi:N-acetylmuramic acid 6-phosphate etherase
VLNMLTTASMIRIGKSYQNLMVDVSATNEKLVARAVRIVMQASGCDERIAEDALRLTNNDVKLAILVVMNETGVEEAERALHEANGFLRPAIQIKNSLD